MNRHNFIIAREGWLFCAISMFITIFTSIYSSNWIAIVCGICTLFILQFFRNPDRQVPTHATDVVLSPADGRVIAVENCFDDYGQTNAIKISIFMNVFNMHSNRIPITGTIVNIMYFTGKFFNASLDKAAIENERNAVIIKTQYGGKMITVVQIAGLIARRISCYIKPGDAVSAGERFGFIKFGSRLDVYLPLDSRVMVSLGDVVNATTTVLATI